MKFHSLIEINLLANDLSFKKAFSEKNRLSRYLRLKTKVSACLLQSPLPTYKNSNFKLLPSKTYSTSIPISSLFPPAKSDDKPKLPLPMKH